MTYAILNSTANLVDAFNNEEKARHALEAIFHQDPESADEYALLTYDDDGQPVGEACTRRSWAFTPEGSVAG